MLPLGRKNARKCSECDITCHANCMHLVPDFCGMSMETANRLLRDMRLINQQKGAARTRTHAPVSSQDEKLSTSMDRMRLSPTQPTDPYRQQQPPDARYSGGAAPGQYQQQPAGRPPPGRVPPPSYEPTQGRPSSQYEQPMGDQYQAYPVQYFFASAFIDTNALIRASAPRLRHHPCRRRHHSLLSSNVHLCRQVRHHH